MILRDALRFCSTQELRSVVKKIAVQEVEASAPTPGAA